MKNKVFKHIKYGGASVLFAIALTFLCTVSAGANATIPGINGAFAAGVRTFNLYTGSVNIDTPDGDSLLVWLYGDGDAGTPVQYPGPTLIVNQGDTVVINLTNNLSRPVSIVFPGQGEVTDPAAPSGTAGLLTREASATGGTVSYQFTATHPGTYMYHSGTDPELQVELGLVGAIIVRPSGFDQETNRTAYGHADTAYDHEYLFLLTEMDYRIHDLVGAGGYDLVDNTTYFPYFWFINGRNGLDTLQGHFVPWAPNQPYGALARTHPGEIVLLRLIGGGRDMHPFHPHGNHSTIIARDGRMVTSDPTDPNVGPDLRTADFTYNILPGGTYDTLFDWTGEKLGWDIYGTGPGHQHFCNGKNVNQGPSAGFDPVTHEYCPDHGKEFPVILPGLQDITLGGLYTGDPFLGSFGDLPPGEGGLNLNGGLTFIWHSHDEKELINNDIFPGGMLTFVIIEPPGIPIP